MSKRKEPSSSSFSSSSSASLLPTFAPDAMRSAPVRAASVRFPLLLALCLMRLVELVSAHTLLQLCFALCRCGSLHPRHPHPCPPFGFPLAVQTGRYFTRSSGRRGMPKDVRDAMRRELVRAAFVRFPLLLALCLMRLAELVSAHTHCCSFALPSVAVALCTLDTHTHAHLLVFP
jgi:hypothetical protein